MFLRLNFHKDIVLMNDHSTSSWFKTCITLSSQSLWNFKLEIKHFFVLFSVPEKPQNLAQSECTVSSVKFTWDDPNSVVPSGYQAKLSTGARVQTISTLVVTKKLIFVICIKKIGQKQKLKNYPPKESGGFIKGW